ncbi:hypothetical protein [Sulfitobacter sp. M13]
MPIKVIHIANVKSASANPGVRQQMEWEKRASQISGLDLEVELWSLDESYPGSVLRQIPSAYSSFLGRRLHLYRRVRKAAGTHEVIIVRHTPVDPFGMFLGQNVRAKTWYVFHTLTYYYLRTRGHMFGRVLSWSDRLFMRLTIGKSAGIIGVTDEIVEHEKKRLGLTFQKTYVYPNGLHLGDWNQPLTDSRGGDLKVIFIASQFFEWNGLEKILLSIKEFDGHPNWELHLVGRLLPHQEAFIVENNLEERVVRYGVLPAEDIWKLLQRMDLSLGAFSLDIVNAKTACTLKVRESLSAGVPVYSGHGDVGVGELKGCYEYGPPDWSCIIRAAKDARSNAKDIIRKRARAKIDKVSLLNSLEKNILCSNTLGK